MNIETGFELIKFFLINGPGEDNKIKSALLFGESLSPPSVSILRSQDGKRISVDEA